ncbi:MAG: hypothetical protein NTW64_04595 [Candidatus Omnitrophica bacterium]|nr:hypothetical protein [Candidatus Omnitrophota bacterium]
MYKNNSIKSFVLLSRTGCLLPFLIIFNLFFGLLFFRPFVWLLIQAILILLFLINGYIITRKINSASSGKRNDVIDVTAEIVEEEKSKNKQLE